MLCIKLKSIAHIRDNTRKFLSPSHGPIGIVMERDADRTHISERKIWKPSYTVDGIVAGLPIMCVCVCDAVRACFNITRYRRALVPRRMQRLRSSMSHLRLPRTDGSYTNIFLRIAYTLLCTFSSIFIFSFIINWFWWKFSLIEYEIIPSLLHSGDIVEKLYVEFCVMYIA